VGREDLRVGGSQAAQAVEFLQAVEFVRALHAHLVEMASQLAWIERQDVTGRNARAYAMRSEAAVLRREINEAQVLIDQLRRRHLNVKKPNRRR
jgi:hypothetical protein